MHSAGKSHVNATPIDVLHCQQRPHKTNRRKPIAWDPTVKVARGPTCALRREHP
jgi:hypothetical protein